MKKPIDRFAHKLIRRAILLLGPLLMLLALAASLNAGQPRGHFSERLNVGQALVPVVARTATGYAHDLRVDDFRLFIDGDEVTVQSLDGDFYAPRNVVFLQDLSGSMALGGRLDKSRRLIDCVVEARRGDRFSLVTFGNGRVDVGLPFSSDPAVLRRKMAAWSAFGTTGLHDALSWLPEVVLESSSPKRAAVLMTDGLDNASNLSADAVRRRLGRAGVPVYVVALHPGAAPSGGAERPLPGDVAELVALAEESGGRYFDLGAGGEPDGTCAAISSDLRYQYVLGFSVTGTGPRSFRRVEVALAQGSRARRVDLSHKYEYYGGAPQTQIQGAGGK